MQNIEKEAWIIKVLLVLGLFFSFCYMVSHNNLSAQNIIEKEQLVIEPLFDNYSLSDTIFLPLVNVSDTVLYYTLSLEEKETEGWRTIINDVFKSPFDRHEARNVKIVQSGQLVVSRFALPDFEAIAGFSKKRKIGYRFCFQVKKSPFDKDGEKYCSTIFRVEASKVK